MKSESNNRLIVIVCALVILLVALFQKFIFLFLEDGIYSSTLHTIDIKGSIVVFLGLVILVYGYRTMRKIAIFLGYLMVLGGYTYTLFAIIKAVKMANEYGLVHIKFELGFYMYVLSAIIIIIGMFIGKNNDVKDENISLDHDSFLLCNMVVGIKEIPFNSLVLLKNVNDNLSIEFQAGDKINKIDIALDSIIDISVIQDLSVSYDTSLTADSSNFLLSYSLFGGRPLMALGANALLDEITADYEKGQVNSWFVLTIKYKQQEKILEIKFKTTKDPKNFIARLKNME